jgi:membrane-bound inhibitor of C-type lysozyme
VRQFNFIALLGLAGVAIGSAPAAAQTFTTYDCRDGARFVVAFYPGDETAHVQLDGKTVALTKRTAVVGSRYAKGDITLRMTKTGTTLKRGKHSSDCTAR